MTNIHDAILIISGIFIMQFLSIAKFESEFIPFSFLFDEFQIVRSNFKSSLLIFNFCCQITNFEIKSLV